MNSRIPPESRSRLRLWQIPLDAPPGAMGALAAVLSASERERAEAFHFAEHRRRFVVRRAALRAILGARLGIEAAAVRFSESRHGRPVVANPEAGGIVCSASHSGELALVALGERGRLGIDLESIRPMDDAAALAARFFAEDEIASLHACGEDRWHTRFFRCWVMKEAFVKALGEGLHRPLDSFAVAPAEDDTPRLLWADGEATEDWHMRVFEPRCGWVAAVAATEPPPDEPDLRFWSIEALLA